jgi:hypothetical protein
MWIPFDFAQDRLHFVQDDITQIRFSYRKGGSFAALL